MRPKITFSHKFEKLLDGSSSCIKTALLLEVIKVNIEDLHHWMITYDTSNGMYKLPEKGEFLMLIFFKPNSDHTIAKKDVFTTLRKFSDDKLDYYRRLRGEIFDVVIESKESLAQKIEDLEAVCQEQRLRGEIFDVVIESKESLAQKIEDLEAVCQEQKKKLDRAITLCIDRIPCLNCPIVKPCYRQDGSKVFGSSIACREAIESHIKNDDNWKGY